MTLDLALLDRVVAIAADAATAIIAVYDAGDFAVASKADSSPVTIADTKAHAVLHAGLERLLPGVPVLSEEGEIPDFAVRRQWPYYWLIDPLDGTKEFIQRNGEFTVNIALVDDHMPVLGVVHVPVSGVTYAGIRGIGSFKFEAGERRQIRTRTMAGRANAGLPVAVVASRSHGAEAVTTLLSRLADKFGAVETCNMGSSLKFCLVAEGLADLYPRLGPTSEWDTAAAQAVVEAAGGLVLDRRLGPLRYNTKAELLNPHFYVLGDSAFQWPELLEPLAPIR